MGSALRRARSWVAAYGPRDAARLGSCSGRASGAPLDRLAGGPLEGLAVTIYVDAGGPMGEVLPYSPLGVLSYGWAPGRRSAAAARSVLERASCSS